MINNTVLTCCLHFILFSSDCFSHSLRGYNANSMTQKHEKNLLHASEVCVLSIWSEKRVTSVKKKGGALFHRHSKSSLSNYRSPSKDLGEEQSSSLSLEAVSGAWRQSLRSQNQIAALFQSAGTRASGELCGVTLCLQPSWLSRLVRLGRQMCHIYPPVYYEHFIYLILSRSPLKVSISIQLMPDFEIIGINIFWGKRMTPHLLRWTKSFFKSYFTTHYRANTCDSVHIAHLWMISAIQKVTSSETDLWVLVDSLYIFISRVSWKTQTAPCILSLYFMCLIKQ